MKYIFIIIGLLILFFPSLSRAMPPGSLVYRTSGEGKMYGYSGDPLVYTEKGIVKNIYSGHVGIYIGAENGIDYVVEALAGGIVKTPANQFVNLAEGEQYLGAKIPKNLSALQQAKVIALAKSLVGKNLAYDYDFKKQKGPYSGEWTCVGLAEKLYESANISNPNNLGAIEYDSNYYALNITPDGYDNYSIANSKGDCFSRKYEFSKIARRSDMLIPAPELIGFDLGLEKNGERYIFLPYTQFLQPSLSEVATDIPMASSFSGVEVRGAVNTASLVLRWSLINNPNSSINLLKQKAKNAWLSLKNKIFGSSGASGSWEENELIIDDSLSENTAPPDTSTKTGAVINKAVNPPKSQEKKEFDKTISQSETKKTESEKKAVSKKETEPTYVNINKAVTPSANPVVSKTQTAPASSSPAHSPNSSTTSPGVYYYPVTTPTININTGTNNTNDNSAETDNTPKIATISRVYSTGDDDWVELYNMGDNDFDLAEAGYRLERAKTAADPTLIFRIGNSDDGSFPGGTIIKAHDTYMIVKNTASAYYLAKADAVATRDDFSWPGSAYTLFLGTGAISSNIDADIIEAVGFGPDATYFQGNGPALAINDYYVLKRFKSDNDNKTDFTLIKTDDPSLNWTEIDNANDEENDNASSTDDIVNETDEDENDDENDGPAPLIINAISSTGVNDYVELYNPNDYDINLEADGYRLEKTKTALDPALLMRIGNTLDGEYPKGTTIFGHGKYLIVRDDAAEYYKEQASAIALRSEFSWFNSGYTLYLGTAAISSSSDADIKDMVGFGSDAVYWQGIGPASEITNNYVLQRIATSGNNNLDFELVASNDPSIDWSQDEETAGSSTLMYNFQNIDPDLFPEPEPIESDDLSYIWHFDECGGLVALSNLGDAELSVLDRWRAGKFRCAKEAGFSYGGITGAFNEPLDINNFSLSFWFKATLDNPRLSLTLANNAAESINMTLEEGQMQFSGLPNPDWQYHEEFPFNDVWRLATLVVNRNEGYWALYINGEEKFKINSYQILPPMELIELAGNNGPYAIDELAVWQRALSVEEILEIYNLEEPFAPLPFQEPQAEINLKHFWNFNEGIGILAADLVGNADLAVEPDTWQALSFDNFATTLSWTRNFGVEFPTLESNDLSLTFKWRSLNAINGNRAKVSLSSDNRENILALIPAQYSSYFNFNGHYDCFSGSSDSGVPPDTNWHYLALVYDSYRNHVRYYVDGTLKGERSYIWPPNRAYPNMLAALAENGNSEIDDLGVWEGALNQAQIQVIFANN